MAVAKRVVRYLVLGALVVVLLAAAGVLVLTRTGPGVERAGQFIVQRIEGSINGSLTVDRVTASGSLLRGVTLHGVIITDARDRPFVRADSARLNYSLRTLISGSVIFDGLTLYGPDVILERLPGESEWNYDRILRDTTAADSAVETTAADGEPTPIVLRDAAVVDGRLAIRTPWEPEPGADTARLILEEVPGGRVRTLRFEGIGARLSEVVVASADTEGQEITVDALATRAHVWRTPVEVQDLSGRVTVRDSVVTFAAEPVRLPGSEAFVEGRIVVGAERNRYDLEAVATRATFRDFRWLYPRLPAQGGGSLRFRLQTQSDGGTLFLAEDAELTTQGNTVAGSFGVRTGETLRFTQVDLRAAPLDLDFLGTLLPDGFPLSGLVIGDVTAEGPAGELRTTGDVRYRTFDAEGNGAESALRWDGTVGFAAPYPLRDLEVELRSVPLAQVAQFAPGLRLRGQTRGTIRADGALRDGVRVSGDLALEHDGETSVIEGAGRFALGDTPTFDLQFDARPVALGLAAVQVPELEGLSGEARGPVTVSGTLDDLNVGVDLITPAGEVVVQGRLALNGTTRYEAEGSITAFRLDRVVSDLPETEVTTRFEVDGTGVRPEAVDGRFDVELLSARVDGVEIYRGRLRGSLAGGRIRVDSLTVQTEVGDATATGSFGLVEEQPGELAVTIRADSLVFLEPVLFADAEPLGIEFDQEARIDGRISVDGRVAGSLTDWRVGGTARVQSFVFDQLRIRDGQIDATWVGDSLGVQLRLDTLRLGTRALARAEGTGHYVAGEGLVSLDVAGRSRQRLELESTFVPEGDVVRLGLRRLRLATGDGTWVLADTASGMVGGSGFQVDSLVLARESGVGRIRVVGVLPWRQPEADEVQEASLAVDLDSVRIGEFLRVSQTDTLLDGQVTGKARVRGTALAPELQSRVDIRSFRYRGATLDSLRADVAYATRRLDGSFSGWERGRPILRGEFSVPIQLELTEREERFLDEAMDLTVDAERVPAELFAFLTPGFRDLNGTVRGELAVRGSPLDPDLQGTLELTGGSAFFEPLNVAYRDVGITADMVEGPEVQVEANLRTENGRGRIRGTLDLTEAVDPVFDLQVNAERLDAARRRDVTAVVDGVAQLRGRYSRPVVTGNLAVVRGELNLDQLWRQYQIVQLDTTLFQMLDTTTVSYRPQPESPFLRNLRVTNTTLRADRRFWIRSSELNMEVSGSLSLEVDRQSDDFRLTGTLEATQGTYNLLATQLAGVTRRGFDIRDGTIEFVGTPGINPNLEIEAAYRVRPAQGEPINVVASVTGTLQDPRVSLSSDADLPLSETDLASYILFGRAGAELTPEQLDAADAFGFLSPAATGAFSTLAQQLTSSLGLPVDYVSFRLPEYGPGGEQFGFGGLWQNAQIEVGFDPAPNVSVIGSVRIPSGSEGESQASALRLFGARIEYRPWQTWTFEGYIEDQFARRPSFGAAEIADRKVLGLSLFREWGY